jgi:hypothetical protein
LNRKVLEGNEKKKKKKSTTTPSNDSEVKSPNEQHIEENKSRSRRIDSKKPPTPSPQNHKHQQYQSYEKETTPKSFKTNHLYTQTLVYSTWTRERENLRVWLGWEVGRQRRSEGSKREQIERAKRRYRRPYTDQSASPELTAFSDRVILPFPQKLIHSFGRFLGM